ncbi:ATP synthase F1 subunit delta [Rickettsiaceae bacterium]|nr:ATP synthase F1 subunit delta [Rickettsiaceae bacterium]
MLLDLKVIKNYTQALFNKASDAANTAKVLEQISVFASLSQKSDSINEALCSPIIDRDLKISLIDKISSKYKFEKISQQFLHVLVKNSRFSLLSQIVEEFEKMTADSLGVTSAEVVSAFKLGKKEVETIKSFLEAELGKKVELTASSDDSLIGGMVIKYDSNLIDCSVHGALERVRKVAVKSKI